MSHFVRKSLMILIGGILLSRFSSAADINDNQLWSSFAVYRPVSRKIILHVGPQYKWGGNAQHHYLTRYDAGADFGVNNWLRPGFGFKRILKKNQQAVQATDAAYVDVVLKWAGNRLLFDIRNRGELRHVKGGSIIFRARQRFRMASAHSLGAIKQRPYVSGEYFYNFDAAGWKTVRLYAGSFIDVGRPVHLDFYYLFQLEKEDNAWGGH